MSHWNLSFSRRYLQVSNIISCFLLGAKFKAERRAYASYHLHVVVLLFVTIRDSFPVDNIPPVRDIFGTAILIFQIISMFPHVDSENGRHPIRKRSILIRSRKNGQAITFLNQPRPAGAKASGGSFFKFSRVFPERERKLLKIPVR